MTQIPHLQSRVDLQGSIAVSRLPEIDIQAANRGVYVPFHPQMPPVNGRAHPHGRGAAKTLNSDARSRHWIWMKNCFSVNSSPAEWMKKEPEYALDRLVADGDSSRSRRPLPTCAAGAFRTGWCFRSWLRDWPYPLGSTAGMGSGTASPALALGGLLFGVLCWMGGMGMGDVKLCAAIGAWIGPAQLLIALVVTGIAGALWRCAGPPAAVFLANFQRNGRSGRRFQGARIAPSSGAGS